MSARVRGESPGRESGVESGEFIFSVMARAVKNHV